MNFKTVFGSSRLDIRTRLDNTAWTESTVNATQPILLRHVSVRAKRREGWLDDACRFAKKEGLHVYIRGTTTMLGELMVLT